MMKLQPARWFPPCGRCNAMPAERGIEISIPAQRDEYDDYRDGACAKAEGKMGEGKEEKAVCPHCNQTMDRWRPPSEANWDAEFHYVCFNDECPYYKNGWQWMMDHYNVRASYRNRTDPQSGRSSPLPVWSPTAHKDAIVKE